MIEKQCLECGNSYMVRQCRANESKFCSRPCRAINTGKKNIKDLTGLRVGKLTVSSFAHTTLASAGAKNDDTSAFWRCICDCGTELIVSNRQLRAGLRVKNGVGGFNGRRQCDNCSPNQADKYSIVRQAISGVKYHAKRRNIDFKISKEYLLELFEKQQGLCAISKLPMAIDRYKVEEVRKTGRIPHSPSIDRIDPKVGYVEGNVQFVLAQVNFGKSDFSQQEFIDMCYSIVEQDKKNKDINDV